MDEGADAPRLPGDKDRLGRTLDAFAARREAAKEAIRRMREAVERSRRLLTETAEEIENSHREPFTKYGARRERPDEEEG